jgi:predicted nucleic acid-binding Zn ribbon protein
MICPDRELEKASMLYEQRKLLGKLIDLSKATGLATNSNEDYERKLYNNYKAHSLLARSWLFLYNLVKTQKDVLSKLVFIGRNPTSAKKDLTDLLFFQSIGLFYNFHIDENNIFQIQDNGFLDALVGVDVTRIRQCVICRKFFWANRIDKKSCREKCANTLNQRLSREHKRQKGSQYYEASQVKHKKKSQKD